MCPRCYDKSRERTAVCIDCGELRLLRRTRRCARCYRQARSTMATCGRCGERRRMSAGSEACRRCRELARATGGACSDCRRTVARLWGGRCPRCSNTHWATDSCSDCFAWASSIVGGLCLACRWFAKHSTPGICRSCGRQIGLGRWRRCRLCTASRREAHLSGDPHWALEPGARGAIQLFLGGLYSHGAISAAASTRRADQDNDAAWVQPTAGQWQQLRLLEVPADPARLAASPLPETVTADIPAELAAAVAACAEARGWKTTTTSKVRQAVAILVALGALELTDQATEVLRRHRLPITRVREFLNASGWPQPVSDDLDGFVDGRTRHLPPQIRDEVAAWVEALDGRWGRSKPLNPTTIRHYLNAVLPTLEAWAGTFGSLREVTTDELTDRLAALQGSQRTITAVALRSLFAALKARRQVFVDPARPVHPGHFPVRPVLGLDDTTRCTLLSRLERADHRLVVLLAGVHALTRAQIIAVRLDDVDLDTRVLDVAGQRRPLDPLVAEHVVVWLKVRRERWPESANPHLLVSYKSAYGLGPVSPHYINLVFADLPTTAAGLRADRLLAEAQATGDPLRLMRLFSLSADTAVRYCAEADPTLAATAPG
jgi:hypothetical protein